MPNLQNFFCILKSETYQEKILHSDLFNIELWRQFCHEFSSLIQLDCVIKCPFKSTNSLEMDFLRITGERSKNFDRSIDIHLRYHDDFNYPIRNEV